MGYYLLLINWGKILQEEKGIPSNFKFVNLFKVEATPLTIQKAFEEALNLMKEQDKQHRGTSKSASNSDDKVLKARETPSTIQESFDGDG